MTRRGKWLIITIVAALILLMLRLKLIAPAAILGVLVMGVSLVERLYSLRMAREAYRRMQGAAESAQAKGGAFDELDARAILGLPEQGVLTEQAIRQAHKNLMRKLHPDAGGNDALAKQVNEARDVLLRAVKG